MCVGMTFLLDEYMSCVLVWCGDQVLKQLRLKLEHQQGNVYELTQASTKLHFFTSCDICRNNKCPLGLSLAQVNILYNVQE